MLFVCRATLGRPGRATDDSQVAGGKRARYGRQIRIDRYFRYVLRRFANRGQAKPIHEATDLPQGPRLAGSFNARAVAMPVVMLSGGEDGMEVDQAIAAEPGRVVANHRAFVLVTVGWASAVLAGLWVVWCYANAPGVKDASPQVWPRASVIERPTDRSFLMMFAHPKCPCTRASIRELERLVARVQSTIDTCVVFVRPAGTNNEFVQTDLWRSAASIPGVRVVCDAHGTESQRFRAKTSGLVLMYDSSGSLLFSGGITASRGHEGGNLGTDTLLALIQNRPEQVNQTPVFGCLLCRPEPSPTPEKRQ